MSITPFDKSANRKDLFKILHEVEALKIPMCVPVEFGSCETGIYIMFTWVNGIDAVEIIPALMIKKFQDVLTWYDNFNFVVPTWYINDIN